MAAKRTRRAQGRPQGGSEEIVRAILDATLEQLEAHGFVDLRVEEVARTAGVNKTSVYRRWPTKGDLVRAALRTRRDDEPPFVESGDLRRDLVDLLTAKAADLSTPRGRKVIRAFMAMDEVDPEPDSPLRAYREQRHAALRDVLTHAMDRGALPPGLDPVFLGDLLLAPVLHRILIVHEPVDAAFIARVVDHVLAAALHDGAASAPMPRRPAPSPRPATKKQL